MTPLHCAADKQIYYNYHYFIGHSHFIVQGSIEFAYYITRVP